MSKEIKAMVSALASKYVTTKYRNDILQPEWYYWLVMATCQTESSFTDVQNKESAARGLFQFIPGTSKYIGKKYGLPDYDSGIEHQVEYAVCYFWDLMSKGAHNRLAGLNIYGITDPQAIKVLSLRMSYTDGHTKGVDTVRDGFFALIHTIKLMYTTVYNMTFNAPPALKTFLSSIRSFRSNQKILMGDPQDEEHPPTTKSDPDQSMLIPVYDIPRCKAYFHASRDLDGNEPAWMKSIIYLLGANLRQDSDLIITSINRFKTGELRNAGHHINYGAIDVLHVPTGMDPLIAIESNKVPYYSMSPFHYIGLTHLLKHPLAPKVRIGMEPDHLHIDQDFSYAAPGVYYYHYGKLPSLIEKSRDLLSWGFDPQPLLTSSMDSVLKTGL